MSDQIDDYVAAAIAHDSLIARGVAWSASTIARAWDRSVVRRRGQPVYAAFCALTAADRLRYGLVVAATALATRVLLLVL